MATIKKYQEGLKENMVGFTDELTKVFPDLRITSGFRPRAFTKQGNVSRHALGEAIDIEGREDVYNYLWNTKEGVSLLNRFNVGILDETTPEMLAKTGGTGKHYHIGQDSTLVPKAKQRYKELTGSDTPMTDHFLKTYGQKPTNTITNFETPINNSNFVSVPETPQKKEQPKKEEALTTLKEKEFIKQFNSIYAEQRAPIQQPQEYQPIQETDIQGIFNQVSQFVEAQQGGEKNSLWKNIRDNRGSGRKPTKEMLEQEAKIKRNSQQGGIPISKDGVFYSGDKPVIVPSPSISMKGVDYPILAKSLETGETKILQPNLEYFFNNTKNVLEIPQLFQQGGENKFDLSKLKKDIQSRKSSVQKEINSEKLQNLHPVKKENIQNSDYTFIEILPTIEVSAKRNFDINNLQENQIENLSKDEVIILQTKLKNEGFLKAEGSVPKPKNKTEVESVQKLLKSKGYDLGTYGYNKDGVDGNFGNKTKKSLDDYNRRKEGIDGIAGEKTKRAFQQYKANNLFKDINPQAVENRFFEMTSGNEIPIYQDMLKKEGNFKGIDFVKATEKDLVKREVGNAFKLNSDKTCNDTRCTFYVGQEIEKKIKNRRDDIDAYGDAWSISDRLINKGAKEVYSVFENTKPLVESENIEKYLKNRINNTEKIDPKVLKSGDVVNLFYEGSNYKNQAYQEGNKYFTSHAGIIKEDDKGNLFIEHNVGGKIFKEDIKTISQGKSKTKSGGMLAITAVIRPNYNLSEKAEIYDSEKAQVNDLVVSNYKDIGSKNAALFSQTIIKNEKALRKDIPINEEEFNNILKASKAIGWKESGFKEGVDNSLKKWAGEVREYTGGTEMSRGMTQMKDGMNLSKDLKEKYIKEKGNNLSDPTESAIPTFYALSSRYLYLKDLAYKEKISITSNDLSKLAILGWNEDIAVVGKTLKKYKNFEKVMEAYRGVNKQHPYDLAIEAYSEYLR